MQLSRGVAYKCIIVNTALVQESTVSEKHGWSILSLRNKYKFLCLTLILLLFCPSVSPKPLDSFLLSCFICIAIVIFLREFSLNSAVFRLYAGMALAALIGDCLHLLTLGSALAYVPAVLADVVYALFLGSAILLIGREIFIGKHVTEDTIFGGIALYLIIGVFWSLLFDNVRLMDPMAFHYTHEATFFDMLYLSFTTLTTVGYGELTPVHQLAKVLTNLEGVVGTMFPAIFMARLIALYRV